MPRRLKGFILIVDDDEGLRTMMSTVLGRGGYQIRETRSGEEALDAARADRPALVLLDVNLPGISGYDVCHQLRTDFGSELPIVFISGHRTEKLDQVAGLRLGADDYIVKPFDAGELLARIDRLVDRVAGRKGVSLEQPEAPSDLTRRESEVLRLLAGGRTPKQLALELSISHKTAATHIQKILSKLDVHSQGQAIALALQSRLVDPAPPIDTARR